MDNRPDGLPADIELRVASGTTLNNVTFKPMLNKGTTAQPYRPYIKRTRPVFTKVKSHDTWGICLGDDDSIDNYDEVECPEEYKGNKDFDNTIWEDEKKTSKLHKNNIEENIK